MRRYASVLSRILAARNGLESRQVDAPVVRAAIEHMREGVNLLWRRFADQAAPAELKEPCRIIASYTARYWVKSFEKATEAAICAEIVNQQPAGRLDILDVGSGSGEMIHAIIVASGRECVVDGFDNMSESDTSREIFLAHAFARDFIVGDFNALPPSLGQYDVIIGLNSLRMADSLPDVVKNLASHLKPGGRLIFNTITPHFHKRFFASCREIAKRVNAPSERFESAANYIPNAYSSRQLSEMVSGAGLISEVKEYLFEDDFPVYSYFPVGYQFLYPYARHARTLTPENAHAYGIAYADFVYTLANTLPAFAGRQREQWRSGGRRFGLHNMAIGRRPVCGTAAVSSSGHRCHVSPPACC